MCLVTEQEKQNLASLRFDKLHYIPHRIQWSLPYDQEIPNEHKN